MASFSAFNETCTLEGLSVLNSVNLLFFSQLELNSADGCFTVQLILL